MNSRDETPSAASAHCPIEALVEALGHAQTDVLAAIVALAALAATYPADAKVHFLQGGLAAAMGDFVSAINALRTAIGVSPDFHLARFQLGFVQLCSGAFKGAGETWLGLASLGASHPFCLFAHGLGLFAEGDVEGASRELSKGLALNREAPSLNGLMGAVQDRVEALAQNPAAREAMASPEELLRTVVAGRALH
jgi:tetratricopeptide (TPR) repeat protein